MSDMNNEFEQLLEESLVTIHNGEIVEGTVISVKEDEIVLNIGYKADVSLQEMSTAISQSILLL